MESRLLNHPGKNAGWMSEQEFIEASDAAITVLHDRLRIKLYRESLTYVKEKDDMEGVPLLRLARILPKLQLFFMIYYFF